MKFLTSAVCLVLVLATTASAQSNRAFSATPIANGLTAGTNIGANNAGSDPVAGCGGMDSTVWYVYTASCNGTCTAQTCAPGSATYDTVLAAYQGSSGCSANDLVGLVCNDDSCFSLQSSISFSVVSGATYYICVGGYFGLQGNFTLSVGCAAAGITNDECAGAIGIGLNHIYAGTNAGSTTSAAPSGCNSGNDVWYTFTAAANGPCTVSTCDSAGLTNFDTVLNIYSGGCGALAQVICNDDNCGVVSSLHSNLTFTASAGTQYWIGVGGFVGSIGRFGLKVSQAGNVGFSFFDQGAGTVGFRVVDTGGAYYFFVTTSGTNFPFGWFYGINMTWADVISQATGGFPFQGPITACGNVGVFPGVPSGLTVYAVAMSAPSVGGAPTAVSAPVAYTTL